MARQPRPRQDSEVGICRAGRRDHPGYLYRIVIPGQGEAQVYYCQKHAGPLLEIMGLGEWKPYGNRKGHRVIEKEDLGELLGK